MQFEFLRFSPNQKLLRLKVDELDSNGYIKRKKSSQ